MSVVQFKKPVPAKKEKTLAMLDELKQMVEKDEIDQFVAAFVHSDNTLGTARAINTGDYRIIGAMEIMKAQIVDTILYPEENEDG